MERLSTPVRNCINKVWKRYEPQTVEQLIYLVDKYCTFVLKFLNYLMDILGINKEIYV